jgi:hypothetical protein
MGERDDKTSVVGIGCFTNPFQKVLFLNNRSWILVRMERFCKPHQKRRQIIETVKLWKNNELKINQAQKLELLTLGLGLRESAFRTDRIPLTKYRTNIPSIV